MAIGASGTERDCRTGARQHGRGAARRDGGGVEPGAHRGDPYRRDGRTGTVRDHQSPRRRLHRDLLAGGVQQSRARGRRAALQFHGHRECHAEYRVDPGDDHGDRGVAGRRRAADAGHPSAHPGGARLGGDRSQPLGAGQSRRRRSDERDGRGRDTVRERPATGGARGHCAPWRFTDRRDRGRQHSTRFVRQPEVLRGGRQPGSRHRDERLERGVRGGRREAEHDPQGRRQHVQRHGLRGRDGRRLAERQFHAAAERPGCEHAGPARPHLRLQHHGGGTRRTSSPRGGISTRPGALCPT